MFSIIGDAASIRTAAQQLDANLRAALPERIACRTAKPTGMASATAHRRQGRKWRLPVKSISRRTG